jgi:hypothetical protein
MVSRSGVCWEGYGGDQSWNGKDFGRDGKGGTSMSTVPLFLSYKYCTR